MNFTHQILFFFGAIGVFNSLSVSVYILTIKKFRNLANILFGLFLFVFSLRILKSLFYSFSTEEPIFFLQMGPSFFLLIGPLLFSYVLSYKKPNSYFVKYWKIHILVWVLIISYLLFFIPFSRNIELNKNILLPLINMQWLVYIIISGVLMKSSITNFKSVSIIDKWLVLLIISTILSWISLFFIEFNYFISGSIIFSMLFYTFFLYLIFNKKNISLIFKKNKDLTINGKEELLLNRLVEIMSTENIYNNSDLNLTEVANLLETSTHELSRLINEKTDGSFTDFINQYRIEEAKRLIKTNILYTIEAIGNQSGFNSKSAFYKAFRKVTGTTPAKYKAKK